MSADFTRRSLATGIGSAGLGIGGLALLAQKALADTPFTSFAFPATGAPTSRTMPDRLAEIKNVLDFGADPTGGTLSTSAIQAAVDSISGANRGTIYFPVGFYTVNAPITFNYNGNLSIRFLGEGIGTTIAGNFPGFLFDRNNTNSGSPNNTTGGRIFQNLNLQNSNDAGGCVRIGSTIGAAFRNCLFGGNTGVTAEDSAGNSSQNILFDNCHFNANGNNVTTNGVIIGGGGALISCDFVAHDTAIRAYGNGFHISGGRHENTNTAIMLGVDSADTNRGASGFAITGCSFEGNGTGIDLVGSCSGFLIGPVGFMGHDKSNSGYPTGVNNSQYGLRVRARTAQAGMFYGINTGSQFDVAGIYIRAASSRANNLFECCNASQTGGLGAAWSLPSNAYTAFFDSCNISPVWTFSQLPSGAGNVLEGDEFNISNANTAAWGAIVSGSGGNHALVRWNGSNWTVVGI